MKKSLLFGLLITINSVLFAQNPVADFNYTNVCLGSSTTFTDLTTNTPTVWDWAFGDGGVSFIQNPTHVYSAPGNYTATLIAYNGIAYDTIQKVVSVFAPPSVNAGADQTICLGSATTLFSSGGTIYNWSPTTGLSSPTVPNPSASPTATTTYTVTVTDVNGCVANDMINITVNPLPIINYTSHTQCETSGGFATVNLTTMDNYISSGLNTVNWFVDGSYTTVIPDPTAFNTDSTIVYTQIIDVNGCVNTNIVEVNIPINDISVSPTPVDVTCNGSCDGSITLTPSGGMAPYNYSWTPGGMTTQNLNNLCAGTYTYTIIDANACIKFDDVIISEPSAIVLTDNTTNITCNGMCDGSVSITPSGGTPPFVYSWSPGGITTQNLTNLCAGTNTVTVTDANGCTQQLNSTVTQPNAITINPFSTDVTCDGTCDGYISLTPSGGIVPYSYSWSPGGMTTQSITNLCSGTYTYTVIDANGCTSVNNHVIDQILPNSVINGIIYYQSIPTTTGLVQLIRKDGNLPSDMYIVDTTSVNPTSGEYIFWEVMAGDYIIKALGDTTVYNCASTYSVGTTQWQLAQVYNISNNCNDSIYLDIDLIELPNNSGTGNINGRLVQSGGPLLKAPGEPIPDIDITVDQSPGGSIMAATTTDIDGYFSFTDLPMGTYIIRADMFGYGMDTLQTITFNGTNNSYNVTLCSNDTINMVDMCNMTITGINDVVTNSVFNIYPNPAKDFLNINNNSDENITIEINDLTGKKVFTDTLLNNFETIDISTFKKGIYIIKLYNTNAKYIHKLVIN